MKPNQRILLVYPNLPGGFALPHSISLISACLKQKGCIVKLFDTTMYKEGESEDEKRIRLGHYATCEVEYKTTNMYNDFLDTFNEFEPDMILVSITDLTLQKALNLLRYLPYHIFTIVGGVSCILNPERIRQYKEFDFVYSGNAEDLIIGNEPLPYEDYDCYDKSRLIRPWSGKLYKTVYMNTGSCPYRCSFCCSESVRKNVGFRHIPIKHCIDELKYHIDKYSPKFVHITSESFLSLPMKEFKKFYDFYMDYQIPFWCQSGIRDVTPEKAKMLHDMNCFKIAVGIECGNEWYRRFILKKMFTNQQAFDVFNLFRKYQFRVGINSILGLPYETKDLLDDTLQLSQWLYGSVEGYVEEIQVNGYIFQPFYGTELRTFCEQQGLIKDGLHTLMSEPSIKNPHLTDEELMYAVNNFSEYVRKGYCYKWKKWNSKP